MKEINQERYQEEMSVLGASLSQSSDTIARLNTIDSLVAFGGETAERILIQALEADSLWVRQAAAKALGDLDSVIATAALSRVIGRGGPDAKEAMVALGRITRLGPLLPILSANVRSEPIEESEHPKVKKRFSMSPWSVGSMLGMGGAIAALLLTWPF